MINERNQNTSLKEPIAVTTFFSRGLGALRSIGETASNFLDTRKETIEMEKRLVNMTKNGDVKGVETLLSSGVNPLAPSQAGVGSANAWTPLHQALAHKNEPLALVLIAGMKRSGGPIDSMMDIPEGQYGDTELMMCAKLGLRTAAHALVEAGADAGKANKEGVTPFMEMCRRARTDMATDTLATMEKSKVALVLHKVDKGGFPSFFHSIASDAPDTVTKLLIGLHADYGLDINGKYGPQGYAGIHVASLLGKASTIRDLADNYKADVNSISAKDQLTPLMLASWSNEPSSVRMLSSYPQIYLDAKRNLDDTSALHMAGVRGHQEVAIALFQCGASGQVRNSQNQTPAELAAYVGQNDMAKLLKQIDPRSEMNASTTEMLVSRAEKALDALKIFARPAPRI